MFLFFVLFFGLSWLCLGHISLGSGVAVRCLFVYYKV